jgi:hypothetical protein
MKNKFPYILITILAFIIGYLSNCCNPAIPTPLPSPKSDTVFIEKHNWDTFVKKEIIYKPKWKPVYIHDTILDSIPIYVDRLVILTQDSIVVKNDSTDIKVTYNIYSENPLIKIEKTLDYKIRYKEIETIITNQIIRKHALYVGPSLGIIPNSSYVAFNGLYEKNGKTIYKLGLGLNTNFKPVLNTGIYWQILK